MALNLFARKLSKKPIGAHVELTIENGSDLEKVSGIITDSDFSSSVEITTYDGKERLLDYSLIKGFQEKKTLTDVLKELSEGTKVLFSHGAEDQREPCISGTVGENDGEDAVEIITSGGEELLLRYSIIRSLLVQSGGDPVREEKPVEEKKQEEVRQPEPQPEKKPEPPAPVKKPVFHEQSPEDILNASDNRLRSIFDSLPRNDCQKLNSVYERFKYGVKVNDRAKMAEAANQARQILFHEDDRDYLWAREAALFCACLLRRVNIFDHEVCLVGEYFEEAAYCAWKTGKFDLAGAYAIVALLENTERVQDMLIILANSVARGDDISGLRTFCQNMPAGLESQFNCILEEVFSAKGIRLSEDYDPAAALTMLELLYSNTAMAEEAEYWLPVEDDREQEPQDAVQPEKPVPSAEPEYFYGVISRLNWSERTGFIAGEDGRTYTFRYQDIMDQSIAKAIGECLRADLDGKTYLVKFFTEKNAARNIRTDDGLVDRARAIALDATRTDRFEMAFALCRKAVDTPDIRRALGDLVKHAITLFTAKQQTSCVKEAVSLYEKHSTVYPNNAFAVLDIALCYGYLKKYPLMLEHADKALAFPGLMVKQRISILSNYLKMTREYYDVSGDKALLVKMLEKIDELKDSYSKDFASDAAVKKQYIMMMVPYRIIAECGMDMLEAAEADYAKIPAGHTYKDTLDALMARTRARLAPKKPEAEVPVREEAPGAPQEEEYPEAEYGDDTAEEEPEEEIVPYVDADGWDALKLTKKDVVGYALGMDGPHRIPAMLAYLRAASTLNDSITPVYQSVALAANDPMMAPDYNITALATALAASDSDYPALNDCCMAAAFLRTSFISGRGYDYSAQGLRDSISIGQHIPALRDAYDTLEEFRKDVGREIDIYADYRNHGVKKLSEELEKVERWAEDLYTKFVLNPAREGVKFFRLLKTKEIVFARDGYLAVMLRNIMDRNQAALEEERENFIAAYLKGVAQFSKQHINRIGIIDEIIGKCWDQAGKGMQTKRLNETLQGNRRNNLRSNITDILVVICQWYALSEQSAGLTWRTERGVEAYQRLRPQLMDQLCRISEECNAEIESCPDQELCAGLFLLSATAQELSARLDGSWKYGQEKFLYTDFLRSNNVMLNEDFMPDLSATFCILPEFNILARIRRHVEGGGLSFQEQINQIYGMDKTGNNYGTAKQIMDYLEIMGKDESAELPENADRFLAHTEMQIDLRFRSFRETYAFAMNAGQIIKSDAFCYTLEDTVRHWYAVCRENKNYGFFTSILLQAEKQIHTSAQQYEIQLDEQLDALIASNQQYFREHPGYAEAIQEQISNQRFTVAEDWMARIRIGDFSLDVHRPEAVTYLENFWIDYVDIYKRVSEFSRPLSALPGRWVHNKDTKRGRQLIDNWLKNGNPSNPQRIEQLMNLLGWQNIQVSQYQFAGDPRGEIYEVRRDSSAAGLTTPLHPIAAFGSNLEKKRMYVVCLYGIYDSDRLYEKMRTLDMIDGSKIVLLDYSLGQTDRRLLARKLKKRESGLRHVNIVIDRVLITHLADNYNENLINRILMATAMPFTYCQPYVVESVHTLPPELFIGRREELLQIEESGGVNLIYGGRQLGKSALFKKALADLDGRQNQRAVLVDIKDLDCAAAARKVSMKLIDLKITPDAGITDDWDVLCRNIERRLRSEEDEISYFLLMLDEADVFINDCANCGYHPMVALKDIQQSLPGRFKYVLAGLHNIVKFNRQVALGNNSVITHMPSLKITPFRAPEAEELLIGPLSYLGFSLPSKVTVSQIVATCNYFPGLIQLYAKKLIESVRAADYAGYDIKKTPPYVVSDEHLRRVMADKEFVEQIYEKFEITLKLDQDQGSCYYPLTLLIGWMHNVINSKSGYTARDVLEHARDLAIHPLAELDEEKIGALLMELQDLNILRSVSDNSYLLASKNFRDLLGSDEEIFEKLTSFGGAVV